MRIWFRRTIPGLVFLIVVFLTAYADAQITHGDKFSSYGDVSEEIRAEMRAQGEEVLTEIGYKYSHFGLFWLELWTWDGEWCAFNEDTNTYLPLEKDDVADLLGESPHDLSKPFRYRFPLLLVIVFVLAILGAIVSRVGKSNEDKIKKLLADDRYQQAVAIMQDHQEEIEKQATESGELPPQDDGGFNKAIEYLTSQSIERAEAEQNLSLVLGMLAAASEQDPS